MLDAARQFGVTLVTPLPADSSRQARAGDGYDRSAFAIDYDARTVTCPQGKPSTGWTPVRAAGHDKIVVRFGIRLPALPGARASAPTPPATGRQLTILPREVHELQAAVRAGQQDKDWQDDYKRRAGIEATISQAVAITGSRRARYRGLAQNPPRTRLLSRRAQPPPPGRLLERHPLEPRPTSHLARLTLTASGQN